MSEIEIDSKKSKLRQVGASNSWVLPKQLVSFSSGKLACMFFICYAISLTDSPMMR